jgi:PmbA protein
MEAEEITRYAFNEGSRYFDEIAIVGIETNDKVVRFSNNEISISANVKRMNLNFLFKKNRRILQSSLDSISKDSIKSHIKELRRKVNLLPEYRDYAELPDGPFKYKRIKDIFDKRILDEEKIFNLIEDAINYSIKNGANRVCGSFESSLSKIYLFTSKNVEAFSQATSAVLEIRALAKEKIGKLSQNVNLKGKLSEASGAATTCGTKLKDLKPKEVGEEAGKLAKISENPIKVKEGRYDAVLGRNAAAVIFSEVGRHFSAFFVDANLSCFANKIGKLVANEIVDIYDDGRIAGGIGSIPFDAEGYPTQKTQIISKGVAKSYLHNSITAKKFKTKSTGNAGWIIPMPHNIFVSPKDWKEEELIEEVKRGIYINNLGYLRYQDELSGDFSAVLRDGIFLIENGELKKPIRDFRLNANLINFLKSIEGISNKSIQTFHWWMEARVPVFTPKVLVRNLRFTLPIK